MRKSSEDTVIEDVEGADGLVFMAQRVFISRTIMMVMRRRRRTISPIIRVLSGDEDRTGEPGVVVKPKVCKNWCNRDVLELHHYYIFMIRDSSCSTPSACRGFIISGTSASCIPMMLMVMIMLLLYTQTEEEVVHHSVMSIVG